VEVKKMTTKWEYEGKISERARIVHSETGEAVDVECDLDVLQEYIVDRNYRAKKGRKIKG
jgi:hypothetical protein